MIPSRVLIRSALALMMGAAMNAHATGAPSDVLPFKAVETTLANGLKVIVVPTGFPNLVSLQIPVKTGSRNEVEPGKSGFAHFFEHMMFRGTEAYPPEAYQALITRAGARQNAYTTDDYTNYHVTFAKEDLDSILAIEADRFRNLSYAEEAFKTEARAVLGEYNKNSANPIRKLLEVQRENAFQVHTYQHTTMGFLRDIEAMPEQYAYAQTFFDRWYRPEHAALIVAGDVSAEEVLPLVEKHWGGWQRGSYTVEIPQEPAPQGSVYAHVPWPSDTLPLVTVGFHAPAFSTTDESYAALELLLDLRFGPTSDLYKRLVEVEQKVDQLFAYYPGNQDPYLATVFARVKKPEDALYVRDRILETFAEARRDAPTAARLEDAKSNARYSLIRRLDNTEEIAATLARFVRYERDYDTLNEYYRLQASLTPEDLKRAASESFEDARLVVTTLSKDPLDEAIGTSPALASLAPEPEPAAGLQPLLQRSELPQLVVKLVFAAGSAHDPSGKQGLAALAAAMIAEAGSQELTIDEIKKALFPMAGSLTTQVDKELTTFTLSVHRDNWRRFAEVVLPQLTEPGFRSEDFERLRDAQHNGLVQDLRSQNEEELGKERLQTLLFAGTPYGHTVLGSAAGIDTITLDDVKGFAKRAYTQANLRLGVSGDAPQGFEAELARRLGALPEGPALEPPRGVVARRPEGLEVEIVEKETRATAISFGHPIEVTRSHPDFPALSVARAWLGEHRSSMSHLYQRIREARGMNYGDYAYIEAFPRGMFQFFPDPNIPRRAQLFEVWIRPVVPENAHMALRIALHELEGLIENGLSQEDFESTRNYLMKNVYVMTATQEQRLGYALDSDWYGIPEFTGYMRDKLAKLTRDQVNQAIGRHLSAGNLAIVFITKDARGLAAALIGDEPSSIRYDAEKPAELLAEDERIGKRKLGILPQDVRITPLDEVFAK